MLRGVALGQALGQTGVLGHGQIERGSQRLALVIAKRQLIIRHRKLVLELRDPCIRRLELLAERLFRGRLLGQAPLQADCPGARQFQLIGEFDFPASRRRVEFRLVRGGRRLRPRRYGRRMRDSEPGGLIQPTVALCLAAQCHLWRVDCCPIQRT